MIENLRNEFIQEAKAAPKLFKDLAKVEQYIAESYKTRALIELMQNADDSGASKFGIHSFNNGFIVGNNGKPFTQSDVESLCRSGSSNKRRGGETIGYRGIGFKSVVNIANIVNIISGDFKFSFERSKTSQILNNVLDVPLIRIPHIFNQKDIQLENEVSEIIDKFNYNTVFIFGNVIEEISREELNSLDRSSLLFLKNLNEVHIDYKDIHRNIFVKHNYDNNIVQLIEEQNVDEWKIEHLENNKIDLVAYKIENGAVIPALSEESVIHSFTPTSEFSGAFIKINGDYTTDPSRKTIDLDDLSKNSFNNAVKIIVKDINSIMEGNLLKQGFFSPFINIYTTDSSRFKKILFKEIEEKLKETINTVRIKPDWLNFEDYEKICFESIKPFHKNLVSTYPEIFTFFKSINTKTLNIKDIFKNINNVKLSEIGYAEIFTKIITHYRYDLDSITIEKLKKLNLFPTKNGVLSALSINKSNQIDNKFKNHLNNNSDLADLKLFYKKLEIELEQNLIKNNDNKSELEKIIIQKPSEEQPTFKATPTIKKWRSSEKNAQEYLKALNVALSVKDVTEANLGYDLEMMLHSGKRIYIEVKSVNSFTEPFKISNNEYSSAHNYGSDYYIALVINNEDFKIKFVPNPISTLNFEKKCERWSWFCGEYINELQEIDKIIK